MRGHTLRIPEVQEGDRGIYKCVVANAHGSIEWEYEVAVHRKCTWTLHFTLCMLHFALCTLPLSNSNFSLHFVLKKCTPMQCQFVIFPVAQTRTRPIFVTTPENQTVYEGEKARLECRMLSSSAVQFQWLKHYTVNGSNMNEDGELYFEIVSTSRRGKNDALVTDLIIPNVTLEDAGRYMCHVTNHFGRSHRSAWLTVLPGQ